MLIVTELTRTGDACPSQWEGRTDDGAYVYVRYRFGRLAIGVGLSPDEAVDSVMRLQGRRPFFETTLDPEEWDGALGEASLMALTVGVVGWRH